MNKNETLSDRITKTRVTLVKMLHDGKVIDEESSEWLVALIENMYKSGAIEDHAGLLTKAKYGNTIIVDNAEPYQGPAVTNFQPLCEPLVQEQVFLNQMSNKKVHVLGAERQMMGEVLRGVERAKQDGKADAYIAGSSTTDILKVEVGDGAEGEEFKRRLGELGDYFHAKDIYQRMDYMIKTSDAFVIMPGGAGTVQELAALLMLKSEGAPSMRDKPIVIYNRSVSNGSERGFYDTVLSLIPPEERERLGITVVTEQEALKPALDKARENAKRIDASPYNKVQGWAHQRLKDQANVLGVSVH